MSTSIQRNFSPVESVTFFPNGTSTYNSDKKGQQKLVDVFDKTVLVRFYSISDDINAQVLKVVKWGPSSEKVSRVFQGNTKVPSPTKKESKIVEIFGKEVKLGFSAKGPVIKIESSSIEASSKADLNDVLYTSFQSIHSFPDFTSVSSDSFDSSRASQESLKASVVSETVKMVQSLIPEKHIWIANTKRCI